MRPLDEATREADVECMERKLENRRLKKHIVHLKKTIHAMEDEAADKDETIHTMEVEAAEKDAELLECLADKHAALSEQGFQQEARPMLIKLKEQVEMLEAQGVAMKAELSERDYVNKYVPVFFCFTV